MSVDVSEIEITLSSERLRLKVSPYGASLRGLWREAPDGTRREIITGYTGAAGSSVGRNMASTVQSGAKEVGSKGPTIPTNVGRAACS